MKLARIVLPIFAAGVLLSAALAVAQHADEQKLIEIEKAFATNPSSGQPAASVAKKYLYDGPLTHLTGFGRVASYPKAKVLENYLLGRPWVFPSPDDLLYKTNDPSDPHVRTTQVSDLQVGLYGETALVSYKMTNTDKGHKDSSLDSTYNYGCLDTFIKRSGQWYLIGTACSPNIPLPAAIWETVKKARTQQPQSEVQPHP
jgi:hypothetical protein